MAIEKESVEEIFEDWSGPHAPQQVVSLEPELGARHDHLPEGDVRHSTLNPPTLRLTGQEGCHVATATRSVRQPHKTPDAPLASGVNDHAEPITRATQRSESTLGGPQERGCQPGNPQQSPFQPPLPTEPP